MKVVALVLNADGEPHFEATQQFNADTLFSFAEDRIKLAREKGADWTAGAISFFGQQLVQAVKTGENDDVDMAVTNMALAAWVFDSVFGGITAETYRNSNFQFVVADNGVVSHTRLPKAH